MSNIVTSNINIVEETESEITIIDKMDEQPETITVIGQVEIVPVDIEAYNTKSVSEVSYHISFIMFFYLIDFKLQEFET